MGWMIVCFDLPVTEKELRTDAARFRKFLLDEGYFMLQNSIYVRNCISYEKSPFYINRIKQHAPLLGSIDIFYLTDKQWGNSISIESSAYFKKAKYRIKPNSEMPEQLTFW